MLIECGWIVYLKEEIEQTAVGNDAVIIRDTQGFRVSGMVCIGRILVLSARITCFSISYPRKRTKKL